MENTPAEGNELEPFDNKNPLDTLHDRDLRAVKMKWEGKSAQDIAESCGWANPGYVRRLFMQGGRLRPALDAYRAKRKAMTEETTKEAVSRAKEEALDSIEKLIALKDSNNVGAVFKACEKLLDLAGVGQEFQLVNYFRGKTYEQAQSIVNDLFLSIYGRRCANVTLMPSIKRSDGSELKFNIGSPDTEPSQQEGCQE